MLIFFLFCELYFLLTTIYKKNYWNSAKVLPLKNLKRPDYLLLSSTLNISTEFPGALEGETFL